MGRGIEFAFFQKGNQETQHENRCPCAQRYEDQSFRPSLQDRQQFAAIDHFTPADIKAG
jgi:hypothetical protein